MLQWTPPTSGQSRGSSSLTRKTCPRPLRACRLIISAPTVRSRIEEMRNEGVIKGFYADIDCNVIDSVIKTYINVDVAPSLKEKLYQFLNDSPCVLECDRVTGEYSLIIKTVFKNTSEMDKFINMLQTFGRTKTQIVFSTIINHRAYIN